jgi:alpha-tubulin suppressor-like RCC1 family protein
LQLAALGQHTCVADDEGKVWCWGANQGGESGDDSMQDRPNPTPVRGLPGPAIGITAGYGHTCALLEGGQAYCWGINFSGQSDPSSTTPVISPPVLVNADVSFTALTAGIGHTCGLTESGKVYCWGNSSVGQCGVVPTDGSPVPPSEIPGLDQVVSIDTVRGHTCAVRSTDPTLVCWGENDYPPQMNAPIIATHQLGPAGGMQAYSATPVTVDLGARVVDVGMGYASTYAVTEDGSLYAWGYNGRGQVGSGTTDEVVSTPTIVMTAPETPLTGVREVLRSDGSDQCAFVEGPKSSSYFCWGGDDDGEVGLIDGPGTFRYATPVKALPPSASKMVHGENHACAVVSNDDGVEIVCYGNAARSGSGSTNPDRDVRIATPVVWDPAAFTPTPK